MANKSGSLRIKNIYPRSDVFRIQKFGSFGDRVFTGLNHLPKTASPGNTQYLAVAKIRGFPGWDRGLAYERQRGPVLI